MISVMKKHGLIIRFCEIMHKINHGTAIKMSRVNVVAGNISISTHEPMLWIVMNARMNLFEKLHTHNIHARNIALN